MPLATVCRLRGEKRSGFYTLSLCLTGCGVAWASLNFGQRFTDNLHSVLGFDVHAHVSVVEEVCSVSKAISEGFLQGGGGARGVSETAPLPPLITRLPPTAAGTQSSGRVLHCETLLVPDTGAI